MELEQLKIIDFIIEHILMIYNNIEYCQFYWNYKVFYNDFYKSECNSFTTVAKAYVFI